MDSRAEVQDRALVKAALIGVALALLVCFAL
jgi:hypothetical protein